MKETCLFDIIIMYCFIFVFFVQLLIENFSGFCNSSHVIFHWAGLTVKFCCRWLLVSVLMFYITTLIVDGNYDQYATNAQSYYGPVTSELVQPEHDSR